MDEDGGEMAVTAENVVIAVGTNPARPSGVDFDDRRVIDSDGVMELDYSYCKTMTIVGGGVIGVEYASMFAAMGVRVTLVDARERLLPYVDRDIAVALQYLLRRRNMTFRFGEEVVGVERKQDRVVCYMRSGKQIATHTLLYATGRQGATDRLSSSPTRASRPTSAAGSTSTPSTARRSRTCSPSATSPGLPGWPRRAWSRGGSRRWRRSASPSPTCPSWSRRGSTRSRRSRSSGAPRRS